MRVTAPNDGEAQRRAGAQSNIAFTGDARRPRPFAAALWLGYSRPNRKLIASSAAIVGMVVSARKKKAVFLEDALRSEIVLERFSVDGPNAPAPARPTQNTAHGFRSVTALPKRRNNGIADLATTALIWSPLEPSVPDERCRLSVNNCPRQPFGSLRPSINLAEHEGNQLRRHRPLGGNGEGEEAGKRRATRNERFQKRSFQDEELQSGGCQRCLQKVLEVA